MANNFFRLNLNVEFKSKNYKGLLRKLQTFLRYMATVGIHEKEGKQKVIRRYDSGKINKKGNKIIHNAGKSHRMTIAKLAYQNEFGAVITIKPRYKTAHERHRYIVKEISSNKTPTYRRLYRKVMVVDKKYSKERSAKEQGYLLTDKSGNFVAYFKPNTNIKIPKRSFILKTIHEPDATMLTVINNILQKTIVKNGFTATEAWRKIAKLVNMQMKKNVKRNQLANHPLTIKAKGKNSPLVDEQDRIYNSIKYKIYKNATVKGSKGYGKLQKQTIKHIDKLLASAKQFEIMATKIKATFRNEEHTFHYVRSGTKNKWMRDRYRIDGKGKHYRNRF